jgi:hypothetical protein
MIGMETSVCGKRRNWKQRKARGSRDGMANKAPKMVERPQRGLLLGLLRDEWR